MISLNTYVLHIYSKVVENGFYMLMGCNNEERDKRLMNIKSIAIIGPCYIYYQEFGFIWDRKGPLT